MKHRILLVVFLISSHVFSQQTLLKSFISDANSIEINSEGLDEIQLITSENDEIEVVVLDKNPNSHSILIDEETSILKIDFKLQFIDQNSVFRKYITERLNRVSAVVKLPKNKEITILGTTIDVVSKNYDGNLAIYIHKGFLKLNDVKQNVELKLYQGNVFAKVFNSNIDIKSNKGEILIDGKLHPKEFKKEKNYAKNFTVSSINANVSLTTQ